MRNPNDFIIKNGVLKKYQGPGGDVVIPDGATSIGNEAFVNCSSLTSVTISDSVTSIGDRAFWNCSSLTSVTIPNSVTSIGDYAFGGSGLTSMTIPDSVTSIGSSAFTWCGSLTSVTIPDSVTSIGNEAFRGCRRLADAQGFVIVKGCVHYYTGSSGYVTIPEGVTSIGDRAFWNCSNLTELVLPEGVKDIGDYAFGGSGISTITLPESLENVTENCFSWNKTLRLIRVKKWNPAISLLFRKFNVEKIVAEDFSSLPAKYRPAGALGFITEKTSEPDSETDKTVTDYLRKNAGKLFSYAFDHSELLYFLCERQVIQAKDIDAYMAEAEKRGDTEKKALLLDYQNKLDVKDISKARAKKEKTREEYSDALAERIASRDPSKGIEGMTFVITGKLSPWPKVWNSRAEVQAYLESYGAFLGSSVTKKTDYLVTNDPSSRSEKNIKAREYGAQVIDEAEFNELIGRRFRDAEHIDVPGWLKEIPERAFDHCETLKTVTLPEGVTAIGTEAFNRCSSLTSVTIPSSVTGIGKYAFYKCGSLTDVLIPEGVTSIESYTFEGCSSLTSVSIPDSVTSIGDSAFKGCSSLTSVSIPDIVTSIGDSAFEGCSSLTSVVIPDNVTDIGREAFRGCRGLADAAGLVIVGHILSDYCGPGGDVVIPNGVVSIGHGAFWFCGELTGVTIPDSVTSIGSYAFINCESLTNVTIPDSVTYIGNQAFQSCSSLTSVTIPEGVTDIWSQTFAYCFRLTDVKIPSSVTSIWYEAFDSCSKLTIHAPAGSYAEQYAKENKIPFSAEG